MDVLEALLDGPRARGAFLLRAVLDPPWSLRIEDDAPLTLIAPLHSSLWVRPDDAEPVAVPEGGVVVVRGPEHYTVTDTPGILPDVVVYPGGRCTSVADGRGLWDERSLGVRTWGVPGGAAQILVGSYEGHGEASRPLLSALPRVAVHDPGDAGNPLLDVLVAELAVESPGQRALLDRLLDVLLISTLRSWFTAQADQAPGWFRAQQDPAVGAALTLLHRDVAHPWTVEELAERVGVSRASLGRRFTGTVGEPPMSYLASWRLALAADRLTSSDATVAAIARQVGYGTPFSLSTAFKRAYGMSPQQYRQAPPPSVVSGA
ncbi:AraC family transcriptional regulator [Ornithinimicrobium sp. F0845]|uniref:AraC family transcriptional regulator n=1 Tax=Ornithinimicrobium sp. F0845 TaxID=2926412 RepID=UPI001FF5DB9C|nr:AraC family transcriptional regulator [Ornithinimicrobium sp. F0845]